MTTTTKRKPKVRSITVYGRLWHRPRIGGSYRTFEILINGEFVHKSPPSYGYGNQYVYDAFEWLEANGYVKDREHYSHGSREAPWCYCDRKGIALHYSSVDVPRERDL